MQNRLRSALSQQKIVTQVPGRGMERDRGKKFKRCGSANNTHATGSRTGVSQDNRMWGWSTIFREYFLII